MARKSEFSRTKIIILDPVTVELRHYEGEGDQLYLSWKMARSVATLIALWWNYRESDSEREKRFTNVVIRMPSSGHIDVKELDTLGHPKAVGWSFPVVVVEALGNKFP